MDMIHKPKSPKDTEKVFLREIFSVLLLWLISKKEVHGYELMKMLDEDGGFALVASSKIYPLLAQLTKKGLISSKTRMQGKRARKSYSITSKGLLHIKKSKKCLHESKLKSQFLMEMLR
ncbi:PadR family transcriptional regulator [Candidatus Micrarchaeota archaeon]|nr:PadR family transcriptional regulator [Candidatus Micrarchaeota archaeon]